MHNRTIVAAGTLLTVLTAFSADFLPGLAAEPVPTCQGSEATIYVSNGMIVGGPDAGDTYEGKLRGSTGDDVIYGTSGNDKIDAGNGNDIVCGEGGSDTIDGENGMDALCGGEGNDKIDGGNQDDILCGDNGNDTLDGGNGNDQLDGGADTDSAKGGNGTDQCGNAESTNTCETFAAVSLCAASSSSSVASSVASSSAASSAQSSSVASSAASSSVVSSVTSSSVASSVASSIVSSSAQSSAAACTLIECGTMPDVPSALCWDGSFSGPTGECLRNNEGVCGWEILSCPASSSSSSVSSSAQSSTSSSSSLVCQITDCDPILAGPIICPDGTIILSIPHCVAMGDSCQWDSLSQCSSSSSSSSSLSPSSSVSSSSQGSSESSSSSSAASSTESSASSGASSSLASSDGGTVTVTEESPLRGFIPAFDGNGGYRGHRTNDFLAAADRLAQVAGFGTDIAPPSVGGSLTDAFSESELRYLCSLQRALPTEADAGVIYLVADSVSKRTGRPVDSVIDALHNDELCNEITANLRPQKSQAQALPRLIAVNDRGFPVSKNPTWNACFASAYGKHLLTKNDIRQNPDRDKDGTPRDCAYYHPNTSHIWYFPDERTYFGFDPATKTAAFDAGYALMSANTVIASR